jgi:methyl-accepting chemotaxis protein
MRNSLILKLMGAFLLVIVISALVIYYLTTQATQNAFRLYTTQNSQLWAEQIAPDFGAYYTQAGSWQGVEDFIQAYDSAAGSMMSSMAARGHGRAAGFSGGNGMGSSGWMGGMTSQRLILAGADGLVLVDTSADLAGSQLTPEELAGGAGIWVDGALVGTLILAPADLNAISDPDHAFLLSVNRSILISVLVASAFSLLLVLLFFVQITAPVRQLQKAAGAIAGGDLSQRVTVHTRDELGNLADSFNHMAASLAQAEDQRRKLIADVAHELRTPLAVI